jgi:flagellar biosynthesis component FlhA
MESEPEPGFLGGHKFVHFLSDGKNLSGSSFQPPGQWILDEHELPKEHKHELWSPLDWVLRHLQYKAESSLRDFLGYEETAALLDACESETAKIIRNSPQELIWLVQVLRAMLDRRVPILALEKICAEFSRLRASKARLPVMIDRLSDLCRFPDARQYEELKAGIPLHKELSP